MARVNDVDGPDEAVALANDGFEEARLLRNVAEGYTNFSHDVVDGAFGIDEKVGAPELGDDFFAGDQLFAAADQKEQEFHGLAGELDGTAVAAQLITAKVELDFRRIAGLVPARLLTTNWRLTRHGVIFRAWACVGTCKVTIREDR